MENSTIEKTVLVTGATGFLGSYCIIALLQKGYTVRATLRSLNRKQEILDNLKSAGIPSFEHLSFIEADLTKDDNWDTAMKGCHYVLHVASPFPTVEPEDENELIIPARDGALRVLTAARDAGVKRVVLTSSFAAIGYSKDPKGHIFTENDWTEADADVRAYIKSKVVAEKAAWDFVEKEGRGLELAVINPVGIFGPALGSDYSASIELIKNLVEGVIQQTPPFTFGAVDVRDVADIHILAMTDPLANGERFLATSDGTMSLYDLAQLIREKRAGAASQLADLEPLDPSAYIYMSNEKAKRMLGWHPRSKEEALLASVDSIAG